LPVSARSRRTHRPGAGDLSTEAAADGDGDGCEDLLPRFASLPGLHPASLHAVERKMQITTMTEIQHKAFEAASSGRNVLGRARTGTGKTLAFLLSAIENSLRLGRVPGPAGYVEAANEDADAADGGAARTGGIAALILSPTRELAMQIHQQAAVLASSHADGVDTGGRPPRHRMRS
jgi:ATP-dependent RNA helicase DDX18/HAS1